MKLLFRSTLRHIKSHLLQTLSTFIVTILVVSMMSFLFNFVSSFQWMLRNFALEQVGSYHYRYLVPQNTPSEEMLRQMAAEFEEDTWFSQVVLKSGQERVELILTVASPGVFTSFIMDKKFSGYMSEFQQRTHCALETESQPNYNLLVSYGDISRKNGMYAYLLIFFFLFGIIAVTSVFTLGAVFGVSVAQRRRDFALFLSIGADQTHLKKLVLMESACYLAAVPFGYLLGIAFFEMMKVRIDALLACLEHFPEIKLVISVPVTAALLVCVASIILISGFRPAAHTDSISPVEIFQGTKEIDIPKRERSPETIFMKPVCAERWLAQKSHRRYRRRFRPVHLVMSLTFILCFTIAAFRQYSSEAVGMTYQEQDYNLCIELYSDDWEQLNHCAEMAMQQSAGQLHAMREARFELRAPYPLSECGRSTHFTESSTGLPDIVLISLDENRYREICRDMGIDEENTDKNMGIFVNKTNVWEHDGVYYRGNPFTLEKGDTVTLYRDMDISAPEAGIVITISGVLDETPAYLDGGPASRMILLVPQELLMELQPLRPFAESEPGAYHVSLRGSVGDAYGMERAAKEIADSQRGIHCTVTNFEKSIQQSYAGITGFRYLCAAMIVLLVLISICGNFTVSWTVFDSRKREFAALLSVGIEPQRLQGMRIYELFYDLRSIVIFGIPLGVACDWMILKIYSSEYAVSWHFPWKGLLSGMSVLFLSVILTELLQSIHMKHFPVADMLRAE